MRKTLILGILLVVIAGCEEALYRVIETEGTDSVVINASNRQAKPRMRFDIFKTGDNLIEIPVARIAITRTTPTYSVGTLIHRLDGSGETPPISDISEGMLCRKTTQKTLKAEKKIYKYQKKALKRQYKLTKIEGKREVYEALGKVVQDTDEIDEITTSVVHQRVKKHRDKDNTSSAKCSVCGTIGNKDSQWVMKDGKLICLDCYKKMEASKEKTDSRVY